MVKEVLEEEMEKTRIPEMLREKLWKSILAFVKQKKGGKESGNTDTDR